MGSLLSVQSPQQQFEYFQKLGADGMVSFSNDIEFKTEVENRQIKSSSCGHFTPISFQWGETRKVQCMQTQLIQRLIDFPF